MTELSKKYQALFELHGTPPRPEEPPAPEPLSPVQLAGLPEGQGKAALVELLELVSRHPVRIKGRKSKKGQAVWIETPQDWQEENPEAWARIHAAWTRALGVIAGYCMDMLPWPPPAGPPGNTALCGTGDPQKTGDFRR